MSSRTSSFPGWRLIVVPALVLTLLMPSVVLPPSAGAAVPTFTFSGSGWGHGIGLSQYGAKGFAEAGHTGEQIATYYFPETSIGSVSEKRVQVNLDPSARYGAGGNAGFTRATWRIRPGWQGGSLVVGGVSRPDATYTFRAVGNAIELRNASNQLLASFTTTVTVQSSGTPALTQVVDGSGARNDTFVRYRGELRLSARNGQIKLLNRLGMEDYLRGVVPREMPSSWHMEALKAQAIVARSYAHESGNELHTTVWDQVYRGHSWGQDRTATTLLETVRTNQAIDATAHRVVTFNGRVVQTFFHSSSGGHTANIEDVWLGTGQPSATHPFRRGVPDPYVLAAKCPNTPWSAPLTIDGMALASRLSPVTAARAPTGAGATVWVSSLRRHVAASGHVRTVDITWSNGAVTTGFPVAALRTALELRSTRFGPTFPTERVARADRYSTSVAISERLFPTPPAVRGAAVIANGEDASFPDALTAAGLAGAVDGPVLLTRSTVIPSPVLAELTRLQVSTVYLVGGTRVITPAVERVLRERGHTVVRLAGSDRYGRDRYGTAASVAMEIKRLGAFDGKVLVASGESWVDAAIAASISAGTSRPVVLTRRNATPGGTVAVLADLGATETIVFGGPNAITSAGLAGIRPAPARRFGMTGDRFTLAAEVARWAIVNAGYTMATPYIATGERFPDSVTGGVLAGDTKNPLLFTRRDTLPGGTRAILHEHRANVARLIIIGGPAAVSDRAVEEMAQTLQ